MGAKDVFLCIRQRRKIVNARECGVLYVKPSRVINDSFGSSKSYRISTAHVVTLYLSIEQNMPWLMNQENNNYFETLRYLFVCNFKLKNHRALNELL